MTEVTPINEGRPAGLVPGMREELPPGADGIDPDVLASILDSHMRLLNSQGADQDAKKSWFRMPSGVSTTATAFAVMLVGVQTVVQTESWKGLTGFARMIRITGIATQGVPITLDGVSTVSALLALRAELSDEPSGRERAAMYLFTLASCAANYWHGIHDGGIQSALYFGGMSLAVMFVFDMILRQIRRAMRRRKGRRVAHIPQFGLTHWLRYPALTFQSWSLAIKDGHETTAGAIEAAKQAREDSRYADLPELAIDSETLTKMSAQARLAVAFGAIGKTDVPAALAMLRTHDAGIDSSHAYKLRTAILEGSQP